MSTSVERMSCNLLNIKFYLHNLASFELGKKSTQMVRIITTVDQSKQFEVTIITIGIQNTSTFDTHKSYDAFFFNFC